MCFIPRRFPWPLTLTPKLRILILSFPLCSLNLSSLPSFLSVNTESSDLHLEKYKGKHWFLNVSFCLCLFNVRIVCWFVLKWNTVRSPYNTRELKHRHLSVTEVGAKSCVYMNIIYILLTCLCIWMNQQFQFHWRPIARQGILLCWDRVQRWQTRLQVWWPVGVKLNKQTKRQHNYHLLWK